MWLAKYDLKKGPEPMLTLSKKDIFKSLECCLYYNQLCKNCPLQCLPPSECKTELVMQTAQHIEQLHTKLGVVNAKYNNQLTMTKQLESKIETLTIYESMYKTDLEIFIDEINKRISKIFGKKAGDNDEE